MSDPIAGRDGLVLKICSADDGGIMTTEDSPACPFCGAPWKPTTVLSPAWAPRDLPGYQ